MTSYPSLPPLHFAASTVTVGRNEDVVLPTEVLHQCLVAYADWGDLAKLACVQRDWSTTMYEAAAQSPQAAWELAQALLDGTHGLAANPTAALKLLQQLAHVAVTDDAMPVLDDDDDAENNKEGTCVAPAMKQIAWCHLQGKGVPANSKPGLAWMQAAARHDVDAAHQVAVLYEYGQYGVETDVVAAFQWFQTAATEGHVEAMAELALCFELGCGTEQSDEEAIDWYMKAADAGHLDSKFSVGEAFEEARGVPQSDADACLWYYKAAVEGDEDSCRALRRLEAIARIVVPGVSALLAE